MGSSASKTASVFNQSINNTMMNVLQNYAQTNTSIISGQQTIDISNINCAGDVTIGGITQKMVTTINTSALAKSITENNLSSILESAVKQASESNQDIKSGFLSIGGSASDSTASYNTAVHNVAASYTYNDFLSTLQQVNNSQSAKFQNIISSSGKCTLESINQNMSFNLISSSIADKLSNTFLGLMTKGTTDQSSSANQKVVSNGPLEALAELFSSPFGIIMSMIVLLVVISAVILLAYNLSGSSKPPPMMLPPQYQAFAQIPPGGYGMQAQRSY